MRPGCPSQPPQAQIMFTSRIGIAWGLFHVTIIRLCGSLHAGAAEVMGKRVFAYCLAMKSYPRSLAPVSAAPRPLQGTHSLLGFLLYQHLPGCTFSLVHLEATVIINHSLTRTSCPLTLLSFCQATLQNLSLCHSIGLLPCKCREGIHRHQGSSGSWALSDAWRTFSIFTSSPAILYSHPCYSAPPCPCPATY